MSKTSSIKFRMQVPANTVGQTRLQSLKSDLMDKAYTVLKEQYPAVYRNKFMKRKNRFVTEKEGNSNFLSVTIPVFDGKNIERMLTF